MNSILVVDDDIGLRQTLAARLADSHFVVDQAADGAEAVNKVMASRFDLVVMDVNMPKLSGIEALKLIKEFDPSVIVIILTAYSNVRDAIQAVKNGAYNYLEKPINPDDLVLLIDRALKAQGMVKSITMNAPVLKLGDNREFVGHSTSMKKVFSVIDKLTMVDTPVLIRGESGTGKELVAKAIHFNSTRKDERFVAVNCSAIPENLIESEFFGHEKGAFTGADARKIGKFQYADGGTLFLDEIGDISPALQVKLLRILQEKRFTPLGSNREVEANVRIIAATHRNLEEMVKQGSFREDLYYRLNVLPIFLPTLRERRDDIIHLVKYFIEKFNQAHRKQIKGVSPAALEALSRHNWPGNIRELENVMEHAFVIESGEEIQVTSLPEKILSGDVIEKTALNSIPAGYVHPVPNSSPAAPNDSPKPPMQPSDTRQDSVGSIISSLINRPIPSLTGTGEAGGAGTPPAMVFTCHVLDFSVAKDDFEKQFIITALRKFKGRINQTARGANIPKKTLLRKIEKYGIIAKQVGQATIDPNA